MFLFFLGLLVGLVLAIILLMMYSMGKSAAVEANKYICPREDWQRTLPSSRPASPRASETCRKDGHSGYATNCPQCRSDELAAIFDSIPADEPDLDAIDRKVTYRRGAQAVRQALTTQS